MVRSDRPVFGVVGGMGALASAEFVKTIYEFSADRREQDSPIVMLSSDPTFPDRTEMLLRGARDVLLDRLIDSLNQLRGLGASKIVICCFTIHHLLPDLPPDLRESIISLVDVAYSALMHDAKRSLLVCSNGTRKLRLFEQHSRWKDVAQLVALPEEDEQYTIHEFIYGIKRNRDPEEFVAFLETLLANYRCDSLLAGCTEVHLLAKYLASGERRGYGCIDPLTIIARQIAQETQPF